MDMHDVTFGENEELVRNGTRANCERFIAEQCAVAGFKAVRESYGKMPYLHEAAHDDIEAVIAFLKQLIGDEE